VMIAKYLLHRATVEAVTKEAQKIEAEIKRKATQDRETVDHETARAIEEMKSKSDAELEKDINR